MEEMHGLKDIKRNEFFINGHGACPGCGIAIAIKNVMRILGPDATVYVPASCAVVFSAQYPNSAFRTPYFFTAFENTGAVTTGIKAAYRRRGKKSLVVGIAGDGGTFDIGLQALSSALDRNEDIIYVCVDNEAFMNTGIQRSSSTPFGAWTTTSPVGSKVQGKRTFKKDLMKIVEAHDPPYAATLSIAHFNDFVKKVDKAKHMSGFRFLHILTPCVPGWKYESAMSVEIAKLAVETGMWTLFEYEEGESRTTYKPKQMLPVTDYLKLQGRFRHMNDADIRTLQSWLCGKWYQNYGHEIRGAGVRGLQARGNEDAPRKGRPARVLSAGRACEGLFPLRSNRSRMAETNSEGDRYCAERVQRILDRIKAEYGQVTLVSEVLSKRPDMFIPYSELSNAVMFKPKFLDQKTMELAAIAAGSALGRSHCLLVHFKQAAKSVPARANVRAIMVGSMAAMAASQAVAYRKFEEFKEGRHK